MLVGRGKGLKASGWPCAAAGRSTTQSTISSCSASRKQDRREPEISLQPATGPDVPLVVSLLERGFGWSGPDDLGDRLERTALVELRGAVVGTLFLERDDDEEASIFGFVIEPSLQGRGIGRAALRQACEQLLADGARRVSLDVDVANDRALGLYTSIGFTPVTTEDYFALPLG